MPPGNASGPSPPCSPVGLSAVNAAFSVLLLLSFPVALLLNAAAAWLSLRLRSTSTFVVYLKNLAAADLLVTLALPSMAASALPGAGDALKAFTCRYSGVVFYSALYTSIALMGLISLDRFFKVVRPYGRALGQSVAFSVGASASVWVVMFGSTAVPTVVLTNQRPANATGDFCMAMKGAAGVALHKCVVLFMEMLFWSVTVLIGFCYVCITLKVLQSFRKSGSSNSGGKKKTKLRVFSVLLVFVVCFVPFHVMRVPFTVNADFDLCSDMWLFVVHSLTLWLSTTNSCLDPLLYVYLSREFRDKAVDMVKAGGVCVGFCSNERVSQAEKVEHPTT
ncbi:P2Y purinoceptor 13-like [Betta splendens]|uniref:P2Y purinoceptor 13-like n=1 Tax=Betta splendens TaxID=158456 RepID=A0A6P7PFW3_BETSP|nr:P2Y purinoceptor 13-like [Betta splendens]